ncbi:hypothetical protein [Streptomyces sp. KL110A]|uniref:hypothetical protein n=1 Tax=Streptomyces sp. KL110A TaxID=3384221 RepID=UPI0038CA2A5E
MVTSRAALSALPPPGREPPDVALLSLSLSLWLLLPPELELEPELLLSQPPPCEPRAPVRAKTAMPKTAIARA